MSISGALSNALTGLNAASRGAEVVASNLANLTNENYGRRMLNVTSRMIGSSGGVSVTGVSRSVDANLLSDKRFAASDFAHAQTRAQFQSQLDSLFGTPSDERSLSARIDAFESSLVTAGSLPHATQRLDASVQRASELTQTFGTLSKGVQQQRMTADSEIATTVNQLNSALERVQSLNYEISSVLNRGTDPSSYLDQRQAVLDSISEIVPVHVVPRDRGAVALFTPGGAILLDGRPVEIGFTKSNVIVPHMTQVNGLLSGLSINGQEIETSGARSAIGDGRLGALFEIRDETTVATQTQLDSVARDMIERFQDIGVDATRAPGDPGIFTDGIGVFDPADEMGIAGRISINAALDPDQGGQSWRLRDGLGAVVPAASGDAALIQTLQNVLTQQRSAMSGTIGVTAQSATGLATSLLSFVGADRVEGEQVLGFAKTRFNELQNLQREEGVDSDFELQRLMLIEQAYAANARMIQTVDEMMQQLLRL